MFLTNIKRVFVDVPNVAFIKITKQWAGASPQRKHLTIKDQHAALVNYSRVARELN